MKHCQISVAVTLIGIVVAVATAATSSGYGAIGVLILAPALIALVAVPFAIVSFVKREAIWCSVVALTVSLGPFLILIGSYANQQMDDRARENQVVPTATETAPMPLDPASDPSSFKTVPPGTELFPPPALPAR